MKIAQVFILQLILVATIYCQSSIKLIGDQNLKINSLFSSGMVLQRDADIKIIGTALPNNNVTINFKEFELSCIAEENGKWEIALPPQNAGGPENITVNSGSEKIELTNIFFGDVWLCSGQSNMNMPLGEWGRIFNYKKEIAEANFFSIRLLTIPLTFASSPQSEVTTEGWKVCMPENISEFSSTAYFFGREIFQSQNIPIGLIHCSKGGSPIEAWMSSESLSEFPEFEEKIKFVEKGDAEKFERITKDYKKNLKSWLENLKKNDLGFEEDIKWYDPALNDIDWKKAVVPGIWENSGLNKYDGIVWYRKVLELPFGWEAQDISLHLGPVDDMDITFFNGIEVGEQQSKSNSSVYKVPQGLVKGGKNVIAVRVLDIGGNGGIWGLPDEIYVQNQNGEMITLTGEWLIKPSINLEEFKPMPERPYLEKYPVILFNGMINPLLSLKIKGAIWYQGESNAERAFQYRKLFPALINLWRQKWSIGDFPFYFVQLANYKSVKSNPADDSWAELREAQSLALNLPNTGMAVAIDIGDSLDVHPKNKQEIGYRLALIARNKTYSENIEYSGPTFKSMEILNGEMLISFDHIGSGLIVKDGNKLNGFAIAGTDRKFYWANAEIKNNLVVVKCTSVPYPIAVRYAWASNPVCNLYNNEGLPAVPFRTDEWIGVTF